MEMYCVVIMLLTELIGHIHPFTVSDTIRGNRRFFYRQLSTYPSKKTALSVSVSVLQGPFNPYILDFYLFNGDFRPERNCSYQKSGQLRNDDLHILLRRGRYRFYTCEDFGNKRSCHGETIVQDFIPRNIGFSIGIDCEETYKNSDLGQVLVFNISLYDNTNLTECRDEGWNIQGCSDYYTLATFPNLIGHQNSRDAYKSHAMLDGFLRLVDPENPKLNCYQHFHELMCHIFTPRCDPQTEQMVPPCREAFLDFLAGCTTRLLSSLPEIGLVLGKNLTGISKVDLLKGVNFSYLPPANGSIPCLYRPVTCPAPPAVHNGFLVNSVNATRPYPLGSEQEYVCWNGDQMTGNNSVTCLYSGKWSSTSCLHKRMGPLPIVLPILISSLFLFLAVLVRFTCSKHSVPQLFRNKEYDAFVCYDIADADYVHKTIIDELEENCDPPFKLCIHKRDFTPSYTIKWNIWNAIKNSNSAIIVMSQSYVDSMWCRDEFEGCYVENLEDPAFRLFVIMMQPVETLQNTDEYMKSFFASRTYLEMADSKVFERIAQYLCSVKDPQINGGKPHGSDVNNANDGKEETLEMRLSSV